MLLGRDNYELEKHEPLREKITPPFKWQKKKSKNFSLRDKNIHELILLGQKQPYFSIEQKKHLRWLIELHELLKLHKLAQNRWYEILFCKLNLGKSLRHPICELALEINSFVSSE